jgi:hypothetical protein
MAEYQAPTGDYIEDDGTTGATYLLPSGDMYQEPETPSATPALVVVMA